MTEILEAIKTRRSCRSFTDQAVTKEQLEQIIEAGLYAASGMGKQSPIFLAVTNKELRDRIAKLNAAVMGGTSDPFYGAPAVIIVLGNKDAMTYIYDGSLAMGNMMLEAEALSLSTTWIHRAKEVFESEEGKQILKDLGIEGDYEGIGNLIVGYRNGEKQPAAPRKENRVFFAE